MRHTYYVTVEEKKIGRFIVEVMRDDGMIVRRALVASEARAAEIASQWSESWTY